MTKIQRLHNILGMYMNFYFHTVSLFGINKFAFLFKKIWKVKYLKKKQQRKKNSMK